MPRRTIPVVLSFLCAAVGLGAVFPRLSVDDLATGADAIVLGTVLQSHCRWTENRERIVTDHVFLVESTLKGRERGQLILTTPGGRVGDEGEAVPGAPVPRPGQRAIAFLRGLDGEFRVLGWSQGWLRVIRDRRGEERVITSLEGLALVDRSGRPVVHEDGGPRSLEAAVDEILRAVGAAEAE